MKRSGDNRHILQTINDRSGFLFKNSQKNKNLDETVISIPLHRIKIQSPTNIKEEMNEGVKLENNSFEPKNMRKRNTKFFIKE
jgi:hypothetical protein